MSVLTTSQDLDVLADELVPLLVADGRREEANELQDRLFHTDQYAREHVQTIWEQYETQDLPDSRDYSWVDDYKSGPISDEESMHQTSSPETSSSVILLPETLKGAAKATKESLLAAPTEFIRPHTSMRELQQDLRRCAEQPYNAEKQGHNPIDLQHSLQARLDLFLPSEMSDKQRRDFRVVASRRDTRNKFARSDVPEETSDEKAKRVQQLADLRAGVQEPSSNKMVAKRKRSTYGFLGEGC